MLKKDSSPFAGKWCTIICLCMLFVTYWSCQKSEPVDPGNPLPVIDYPIVVGNYLALGDSYTIGESVEEMERYPNLLATAMDSGSITLEKPRIIAKTGWTTTQLIETMDNTDLEESYDLVASDGLHPSGEMYQLWVDQIEDSVRMMLQP